MTFTQNNSGLIPDQRSREQLEKELYEITHLFTLVTENNPFNYFWKDLNLVYRGCNRRFAELAGFTDPLDVIGKTDHDMPWGLNNEVGAAACRNSDFAVIQSGKEQLHIQEKIINESGNECWTETSKVPIRDQSGKIVGVLGALEDITERKLAEAKLEKANRELEELIRLDPLTKVANRRHFTEILLREWANSTRLTQPVSFLLFDIDKFKQFNDTYGHQGGDECLERVAATASNALGRPNDFIARYGGEEFVVLLPNTPLSGALEIAEKIRSNLEQLELIVNNKKTKITVSIGAASCLLTANVNPETVLSRADKALYKAKANGKNCICAAD